MKIAICTPVYDTLKAPYVRALANMLIHVGTERPDIEIRYRAPRGHLLPNRNWLAADALTWGADWTLWIDADMAFPPETIEALLAHGKRIVGCNYASRHNPPRVNAWSVSDPIYSSPDRPALEEVFRMGLGVMLIAAPVFHALAPLFFRERPGSPYQPDEDTYFCDRVRGLGEKVFCDHRLSMQIGHVAEETRWTAAASPCLRAS